MLDDSLHPQRVSFIVRYCMVRFFVREKKMDDEDKVLVVIQNGICLLCFAFIADGHKIESTEIVD